MPPTIIWLLTPPFLNILAKARASAAPSWNRMLIPIRGGGLSHMYSTACFKDQPLAAMSSISIFFPLALE